MKLSLCTWKSACSLSGGEEQIMVWGSAVLSPLPKRACCALEKPANKLSPTILLTLPNASNPQFKLPGSPCEGYLKASGRRAPCTSIPQPQQADLCSLPVSFPYSGIKSVLQKPSDRWGPIRTTGGRRGRVEMGKRSHALGPSAPWAETSHFPSQLYTLPLGSKPGFIYAHPSFSIPPLP